MKYSIIILFLALTVNHAAHAQKKKKGKSAEDMLQEQAIDDLTVFSQKDYSFLETYHEALTQKFAGNTAEAKRLLKKCLQERPDHTGTLFALAAIAKDQNLKTEALNYFIAAQKTDPENRYITEELAYLHFEKADFEQSAKNFAILVELEPRHIDWLYAYSQTLVYLRDYTTAIRMFDRIQDQVGIIPEISMMKVDLLRELKDFEGAEQTLLATKKAHPDNVEVLRSVIGYYEEFGEPQKALKLIKELAELDPENGVAHFILARFYVEQEEFDLYLEALLPIMASEDVHLHDKVLLLQHVFELPTASAAHIEHVALLLANQHPNDAKALAMAGELFGHLGNTKNALVYYRKAIQQENTEFRLWTNVLALESAYKDYQELYEDAQLAMTYFPNMPFVYFAAAEAAIYLDKLDEARSFLEAGSVYIIDDITHESRFDMRFGEWYARKGDRKKAIEYFEKALKKDDQSILIRTNYALALAQFDVQLDKALKLLEPFQKEGQTSTSYYLAKGTVLLKKGEYDAAIKILNNGLSVVEHKAELYDLLGDVYLQMGKREQALNAWENAIKQESRNTMIKKKMDEGKYFAPRYY
jgi:tetratricopeptide (TPR) repeat protein